MNPIAIQQYARDRHQEIAREAEVYWAVERARSEAKANLPEQTIKSSVPLQNAVRQLIAFLQ